MKWSAIFRESWRNITTGTARIVTFALLFGAVVMVLLVPELSTVHGIVTDAQHYQEVGASVQTIEAPGEIDGAACAALGRIPEVRAAGALRAAPADLVAAALPSSAIPTKEVTARLPTVLRSEPVTGKGVVISDQVAGALGLSAGSALDLVEHTITVDGVYPYPDDGRRPGLGYAVLVTVPPAGLFDECWIDVWPQSADTVNLLRATVDARRGDGQPAPKLSALNGTLGATFDGATAYHHRLTRYAPVIAALAACGLGYVSLRVRRLEHAAALHARVRKRALVAIAALETSAWITPVVVLAAAFTAVEIARWPTGDTWPPIILAARIGLTAAVAGYLGAGLALAHTRERHLFRYFRNR